MKKIGFLSHLDFNLYTFRLPIMIELAEQGYEVYAIIPRGEYGDKFAQYNIKTIFYKLDRKSLNIFKEIKSIHSIYNSIKDTKLDIINSFMLKPNIYSSIVVFLLRLKRQKIKLICAITGLGSFYIDKSSKSMAIKYIIEFLYKLSFLNANKVIFQNSDDRELFIQKSILKQEKSILIRSSGIDTSAFNQSSVDKSIAQNIKDTLQIKRDEVVVLMVARLIVHKGVGEYIQSASMLKEKYPYVRFLLIGSNDQGNHFNIDPKLLQNKDIEHLGESSNIQEYLSISDIFVLPSYREGVPRTLLEAGAMSKPLVTTDTTGCKEVVEHNFNGLLAKVKDASSLSSCVEVLITDKSKRELFGTRSLELVRREFDIKYIVKQYIDVYENIGQK